MAALRYFFSLLMIPAGFLLAGAGVMAFMAAWTPPLESGWITCSGLLLPLILFLNLLLILYWIFKKSLWFLLPLFAILINTGYLISIFQVTFLTPQVSPELPHFRVASYNVGKFRSWPEKKATQENICQYFREQQTDILCFQEYYDNLELNADSLSRLLQLPYHAVNYLPGSTTLGSAIYSKYPIRRQGFFPFQAKGNDAMWIDIEVEGQIIRVINCHLQTTNFSRSRKEINIPALQNGGIRKIKSLLSSVGRELHENAGIRAQQAGLIRRMTDTLTIPVLICGDFNDPPSTYTYYHIKGNLKDSFRSRGNGYAYTFRGIHKMLRIDFILYSDKLQCLDYKSPSLSWSDHNPVISEFTFAIQ